MTETQTTIIECGCKVCKGRKAEVRGDGSGMTAVKAHNLVQLAHSPLAGAISEEVRPLGGGVVSANIDRRPRSVGGDLEVTRACFDGRHEWCYGVWTSYPDSEGDCTCACHDEARGLVSR